MKKLRELLRANRWFAVVLLLEAAVLASLATSLFGAPYRLQLTPADFENEYPQIAAVSEDGTALQIWNNNEDFVPPEGKVITFSSAGSAIHSGAYEVTVQYFSCQMPDAPTFNALYSAGSLSFASKGNPSAISADAVTLDDCHRTITTRLWVNYGAKMQDMTATLTYGEGQLYLYGITLTEQPIYRLTRLVIFVLLAAVLQVRKNVRRQVTAQNSSTVKSAQVTTGSIQATVSGSGTLTSEDVEDLSVPATVKVEKLYVEQGDTVEAGTLLAGVNPSTVLSSLSSVQDSLDSLDKSIRKAESSTVSSSVKAGVTGRVKTVYAETGDRVADVMYDHGALAVLSMDGYLAVDVPRGDYAAGDTVTVTDSQGKAWEGTVDQVTADTATVLITDDGPLAEEEVTLGKDTGKLYIHSPLKVTGYAGTVSQVSARLNSKVYSTTVLFTLKDTSDSAKYNQLLSDRAELEERYQALVKLYKDGGLVAEKKGSIQTAVKLDDLTPGSDALADTVLFTLDPDETVSITVTVDETDILSLALGQEVKVTVSSLSDETYLGTVAELDTSGTNGSYTAKVTLPKETGMLSGMSADVDVTIEGVENALLVPADAVRKTSATSYVYTAYDEETDTLGGMTEVTVGLSNGTQTEITSGLQEGDRVYYTPKEKTFTFGGMTITTSGDFSGDFSMGGGMGDMGGMGGGPGGDRSGMGGPPSMGG